MKGKGIKKYMKSEQIVKHLGTKALYATPDHPKKKEPLCSGSFLTLKSLSTSCQVL